MNNNIKNTFRAGLFLATGLIAMNSCTDTWDAHYDPSASLAFDGTTMQALEKKAPDFAKVVKAYGYERELASENVYTVWAPATFNVSDYLDANGKAIADSAEVVKQFIKNHVARYTYSLNADSMNVNLMNLKHTAMTPDGYFGGAKITESNISCSNGILHIIDEAVPYNYNLFELIAKGYKEDTSEGKDTLSLYKYLYNPEINSDSLIEDKSVSCGVNEDGEKIWIDSFVIRNNTILKTVKALIYEEDSNYIAILPSSKAWAERYKKAESLLNFNPYEDTRSPGACDSLKRHYSNVFAMTDLFYNKNANEHWTDSLKSTTWSKFNWINNCYYSKPPKYMPEDKEVNDILSKSGTPFVCSNGVGYLVDEYPFTEYEQFFKRIKVAANASALDLTLDKSGKPAFTKNVNENFRNYTGTLVSATYADSAHTQLVSYKEQRYSYLDVVPANSNANPQVSFKIPNTLSGEYDIYIVTCPIWLQSQDKEELDDRNYRFYVDVYERQSSGTNIGQYPSKQTYRFVNPLDGKNYFETKGLARDEEGHLIVNDTLKCGTYKFEHSYYGRNDEGVLIQLFSQVTSKLNNVHSREILVSSIILKPHDESKKEVVVDPSAAEVQAKARKKNYVSIINKRD